MRRNKPVVIGITGGSGSGKSFAANIISQRFNAAVIDADKTARAVLEPCGAAYAEVIQLFGSGIINLDKTLNRTKIAEIVFSSPEMLKKHEAITHKHILKQINIELEKLYKTDLECIIIDAPLLIQSGLHEKCNTVWLITASYAEKTARIINRDNIPLKLAENRLSAQTSDIELKKHANKVFVNTNAEAFKNEIITATAEALACSD